MTQKFDRKYHKSLNNDFRDVRLGWIKKIEEIKTFLAMIDDYKSKNPSSDLAELKLPIDLQTVKSFVSTHLDDPSKKYVFIQGKNGKYVSGGNGEYDMKCNCEVALGWEKFIIEEKDGKIALKSMNQYVSSEDGGRAMRCNRDSPDSWEFFELIRHEDGLYSFKGNNGKYVSSENGENHLICNSTAANEWEKFGILEIKSPADEVLIGWEHFKVHFNNICDEYDAAVEAKQKIDPEDYYFSNAIELHHDGYGYGDSYTTYHQERRFNKDEFKEVMKKADKRINKAQGVLQQQAHHIYCLLQSENNRDRKVSEMFSKIAGAFKILKDHAIVKEKEAALENDEDMKPAPHAEEEYVVY